MAKKFYEKIEELPELEGWSTVPQVAERLGISRQRVNQLVQDDGRFPNVHRVSDVLLIPESDIDAYEEQKKGGTVRAASPRVDSPYM